MMNRVSVFLATVILFTFVIMADYVPLERPATNLLLAKMGNVFVLKNSTVIKTEVKKQEPLVVKTEKKEQVLNILVTFYTNSYENCKSTAGISASGKNLVSASRGGDITYVAAPKNIPFGTKIDVEGIGVCDVQDRGGAITHVWIDNIEYMKLDVFVKGATNQQLLNKGLLKTTGHIIE